MQHFCFCLFYIFIADSIIISLTIILFRLYILPLLIQLVISRFNKLKLLELPLTFYI